MNLRALLVGLIALATVGFVIGTAIERNSGESHAAHGGEAATRTDTSSEGGATSGETSSETGGETSGEKSQTSETGTGGEASHSTESGSGETGAHTSSTEPGRELRPFGIDIESAPFVALAALASMALALLAWFRPSVAVLAVVAVAMAVFGFLDIREVVHQSDEGRTGLAVLAAVIAGLHLAAALIAVTMARRPAEPAERAVTIGG